MSSATTAMLPFVTVPIVPSKALSENDLSSFHSKVLEEGRDPSDVLSELTANAIREFNRTSNLKQEVPA